MTRVRKQLVLGALVLGLLAGSIATAQNDIEDPDAYPDAWYRVAFDDDGNYLLGDGHGYGAGMWYYYPETGWWRQWYYNGPYDPCCQGVLHYQVYIKAVDPTRLTHAEVRFNWSTPQWSARDEKHPPLSFDVPTTALETHYIGERHLYHVDGWRVTGSIEPISQHTVREYNPEWVAIAIRARNAYIYRGAGHSCVLKDPDKGACYTPATGQCRQCYSYQCLEPDEWLGIGSWCGDLSTPGPFPAPVYRFWSNSLSAHFYTRNEPERVKLLYQYAHVWLEEGVGYYALSDDVEPGSVPVHRFWSDVLGVHFYTIDEQEMQWLIQNYEHIWTYEGTAFYAYPEGAQPPDTRPVYRFWSDKLSCHFYTMDEEEKDGLIETYQHVWTFEGLAWYAYEP
jgi:hypothetical protein